MIRPSQVVRIGAPVTGIVAEILVERGDFVEAGQLIARLDTTMQDVAVRSAEVRAASTAELEGAAARIAMLEAKVDRNTALRGQNLVSDAAFEEIEAELALARTELLRVRQNRQAAEVELEAARAERDRRRITSPIAGYVTERALSVGEYWNQDAALGTIAAVDTLHVEAVVGITAFDTLKLGMQAQIIPEAPIGGRHLATISVIDRVLDAASATFGVRLLLPNPDRAIPAGVRCEVRFG